MGIAKNNVVYLKFRAKQNTIAHKYMFPRIN